jgi:hypothetical protein
MLAKTMILLLLAGILLYAPACKKETDPPPPPPDTLFTRIPGTETLSTVGMVPLPGNELLVLLTGQTGVYKVTTDTIQAIPAFADRNILSLWRQGNDLYLLENRLDVYYALKVDINTFEIVEETEVGAGHHILVNDDGTIYVIKQQTSILGSNAILKRTQEDTTESFSVPGGSNILLFAGYYVLDYDFDSAGQPVVGTSENSIYAFNAQDSFEYINGPSLNARIRAFALDQADTPWFLLGPVIFIRDEPYWESYEIPVEPGNIYTDAVNLQLLPGRIWTIGEGLISRWQSIHQTPVVWSEPFANSTTPDQRIREGLVNDQERVWVSTLDGIYYSDKMK